MNNKSLSAAIRYGLLILPAIALGVLAMISGGVSPVLWVQQIGAWTLFMLLTLALRKAVARVPKILWVAVFTAAIAATLLYGAVDGARRWLDLGFLSVNAALLTLPGLIAALHSAKYPQPVLVLAALVLCFQPDLSQLAALAAAALLLLWQRRENRVWSAACLIAVCVLGCGCAFRPVSLQPVEYCEGILTMLGGISPLLMAIGCISPLLMAIGCMALAAVPAVLAFAAIKRRDSRLMSLTLYYAVTMLFVLTGDYPVPFMGFGLSPIAGYFLAYLVTPAKPE